MPDQDIFNKSFSKSWARPARKICKASSPQTAADATARALRSDLKEVGGIPNLSKLREIVIMLLKADRPNALFQDLRGLERNSQNRTLAAIVRKSVKETYLDYSVRNSHKSTLFPTDQEIAERICSNYVETQLHSKLEIDDLETANNWRDASFRREYRKHLNQPMKEIAKSLSKDPSFEKPPRFSRIKEGQLSTQKLLHKPISLT